MICVTTQTNVFSGGGVAQWLACWICALKAPGSNRPPYHWIDLCLVLPDATSPRFVNNQLVSLPPAGSFNMFLFSL